MYRAYYDSVNKKLKTYREDDSPPEGQIEDETDYVCGGKTVKEADLNLVRFMERLRDNIEKDIADAKKIYNQYWPEAPL